MMGVLVWEGREGEYVFVGGKIIPLYQAGRGDASRCIDDDNEGQGKRVIVSSIKRMR